MKGTVGIVDFHAATNYGSALLAYALQRVVSDKIDLQHHQLPAAKAGRWLSLADFGKPSSGETLDRITLLASIQ